MAEETKEAESRQRGIVPRSISDEMRESYLDYAMSVITARALPDVRDGLKPVHRRILYTMQQMGLHAGAKFRKSAAVVGSVMAQYHPHGDSAIYDALVKMAQDFSMRYPLVLGQGNFGCFTGDTKLQLADGRVLSFIELVAEDAAGKKNYIYTYDKKSKNIRLALVEHPRVTRRDAELVRVTLDNGERIRCTPDHRFLLRDGSFSEARLLAPGDSLMPLYTRPSTKEDDPHIVDYEMVLQPWSHTWGYTHHLADEWNLAHLVYHRREGKVRHYKDFNKRNNNPDNIVRLPWQEHWRVHYEIAAERHAHDAAYRERLAAGRAAYYAQGAAREERAERMRERNAEMWRSPAYRVQQAAALKERWLNPEYKAERAAEASARLKEAWKKDEFRSHMSEVKSVEMRERWQDARYRAAQAERMRLMSQELWRSEEHRAHISGATQRAWQRADYRELHTERARRQWDDPLYRAHFPRDHFVNAAKTLWENPEMRDMHSQKMARQLEDPSFREKAARGRARAYESRVELDPSFMQRLTERASVALREKWNDPSYGRGVMRSRILGYVRKLLAVEESVSEEMYEANRGTGIPHYEKALAYFSGVDEMITLARQYNHSVVLVERLHEREDVYDVTVDGTHNFALAAGVFVHNSIDGDPAAAMRYSEAKMARLSAELLRDLEKETTDWRPNYDATRREPVVLPAALPNLLLNGTLGIAVGMATNIPPHNLGEVAAALAHLIDNPEATTEEMLEYIKGPDFPIGAVLYGTRDLHHAYATGRGGVVVRGEAEITEGKDGTTQIIITSIPYRTNKADLMESIAALVRDKKLEGIKELRDESTKDIRVVVGLKGTAQPKQVLNFIYKHTGLEDTFHFNMVALDEGVPRTFSLKGMLEKFVEHRIDVVERRSRFDLARSEEREHILLGLKKALDQIDKIIKTIRGSRDVTGAHTALMREFRFSDRQATAILEMRLQKLAGLERKKVEEELLAVEKLIADLRALLVSPKRIRGVIKTELAEVAAKYGDERRTRIVRHGVKEMTDEDLIPDEESVLVLTRGGYVKRTNPSEYRRQRRGGVGVIDMNTKEEDFVTTLLTGSTLSDILFFTNRGKVYQTKMYDVPEGRKATRGKSIMNFLPLSQGEEVSSVLVMLSERRAEEALSVMMVTRQGRVKRVAAKSFHEVRRSGLIAITIPADDQLVSTFFVGRGDDAIIATAAGQAIRFKASTVREMGRAAAGVRGMRLAKGDSVVGADSVRSTLEAPALLVVSEKGFGKRTALKEYKVQGRGGGGIKTLKVSAKTGRLIRAGVVEESEAEVVAISKRGQVIRLALREIPLLGRATQGVRIMKLREGDAIASTVCL